MKTVTLDILDDKAINLLRDLEGLNIIRLHENEASQNQFRSVADLKGRMSKQSPEEIERHLKELRAEWE